MVPAAALSVCLPASPRAVTGCCQDGQLPLLSGDGAAETEPADGSASARELSLPGHSRSERSKSAVDGGNHWQHDGEVQLAPRPGVPGAIRKRQLVLPRCSARSHPACNPAATSSSSPALGSHRFSSFLSNHSPQSLTLRGGGEAGMGTRAAEAAARTSRAQPEGLFFTQHSPDAGGARGKSFGGCKSILWKWMGLQTETRPRPRGHGGS